MKNTLPCILVILTSLSSAAQAQVWKTLPQGVRIVGYRNVTTSKVTSNFNQFRSESPLGSSFRVDASTFNSLSGGFVQDGDINKDAYDNFLVGEYKIDADAQFNVQGTGFGYGITDRVMFYGEIARYSAQVKTNIKRTAGNTYEDTARILEDNNGGIQDATMAANLRGLIDVDEHTIQSVITNHYGYKPLGDWNGVDYGDMETGFMAKVIDRGTWGLMLYPGVVLPTGRVDDPDILQDVGFGDGQYDFFSEMASGYIVNDHLAFGSTLRYTYQAPSEKTLRIPDSRDFTLSSRKGKFDVKYGDKLNWMFNTTVYVNDWISFTPIYRFMYQLPSTYDSQYSEANSYLSYNTDKQEHQVQLTTSLSSITPFLKKNFILPAQINVNLVQTVAGKNVPKVGRFEVEFRMLF